LTLSSFPLGKIGMGLILGNSVGVAIPQPRVAAKHATLGINPTNHSYSVRVAISRRRYSQLIFCPITKG